MSYTPLNDLEKVGGVAVVTASPGLLAVAGTLTHNSAVPSTANFGVLPAVANSATPTYTDGKQVFLSTDLTGSLRVNVASISGTFTQASAGPTGSAPPVQADYIGINVSGTLRGTTGLSVGSMYAPTVAIVDGSGNQITTFGGGTQYATGTAVATPTGTAALGWDGANVRVLSTDTTGRLKVNPPNQGALSTLSVTTATPLNTALTIPTTGYANVLITLHYSGSVTGNWVISFEASDDNTIWYPVTVSSLSSATSPVDFASLSSATGSIAWQVFTGGFSYFRVRVSALGTGAGTSIIGLTPGTTSSPATYNNSVSTPTYVRLSDGIQRETFWSNFGDGPNLSGVACQSVNASLYVGAHTILSIGGGGVPNFGILAADNSRLDTTITAATAPAHALATLGVYTNVTTPLTNGQSVAISTDTGGHLKTIQGQALQTLTAWTTANFTLNATFVITPTNTGGCEAVIVQLDQSNSTYTTGAVTWQGTYDSINWVTIPAAQVLDPTSTTFAQIANPYTFVSNVNIPFLILMGGYRQIRALASTALTGSSAPTVTPYVAQLAYSPVTLVATGSGTLAVTQGTSPWVVSLPSTTITGSVAVTGTFFQATQPVSGTFWQATQPVSLTSTTITGTVGVTQSTSPWVVSNSGTFAVQASITTLGQQLAAASVPVVLTAAQLTTLTPLTTVAVTNIGTFAVQATLSAETTKVIGTVNQGTSPWVVSLASTTVTGTVAVTQSTSPWVVSGAITEATLDAALISQEATTSGIKGLTVFGAVTTNAPSYTTAKSDALSLDTSGLLRVSLKDTPANTNKFLVTADPITFAAAQHVIVDSGTLTTVSTVTAVTAITNALPAGSNVIGHVITDSGSVTNATLSAETTKVIGTINVAASQTIAVTNTGTFAVQAANAVVAVNSQTWLTGVAGTDSTVNVTGYNSVTVTFNGSGTITTGVATFEASDDGGTTWYACVGVSNSTFATTSAISLTANLTSYTFNVAGFTNFRARNSTTITGAAGQSIVRTQASTAVSIPHTTVTQSVAANLLVTPVGADGATKITTKTSSTQAATADTSLTVQLSPVQPNLTTPLNVADATAESSLSLIQQSLKQVAPYPNLAQVITSQISASATTLTLTVTNATVNNTILVVAMSSTTTAPTFTPVAGTGSVSAFSTVSNSTTAPSVRVATGRVTVAGNFTITVTFASGACATAAYEISGLPVSGSLPNSQPFYDSLQLNQGTATAATLSSFYTLVPGELPFLFVGLGANTTVNTSSPGTTRLPSFAVDGTNVAQNVTTSGNLQTFYAGRISGGPLEDMANMVPVAGFSGSSLYTCVYISLKTIPFAIGGTVTSNLSTLLGNTLVAAASGIQLVGNADGVGNALTSNSTTPTAKFALDQNITSILGTAPTTVGKLDVKGADGDVFVRQTTASNLNATVAIAAAQTLATVTTVSTVSASRTVGNTGAVLDAVTTAATTPANGLATLVSNVTTAPSLTTGQSVAVQGDYQGSIFVKPYRRSQTVAKATTCTTTAATTILAAQAAGIFADISSLVITVTGAAAADFTITVSDGTNSFIFDATTGTATSAATQLVMSFDPPIAATTAATAWTLAMSAANTVHATVNAVLQKAS